MGGAGMTVGTFTPKPVAIVDGRVHPEAVEINLYLPIAE